LNHFFFEKLLTKSNGKRTPPKKDGINVNSRKTPINKVSNFTTNKKHKIIQYLPNKVMKQ